MKNRYCLQQCLSVCRAVSGNKGGRFLHVPSLYAVTKGILTNVAVEDVKAYEAGLYTHLDVDAAGVEVMQTIRSTGKLEADTEEKLKKVLDDYTENFLNTRPEK